MVSVFLGSVGSDDPVVQMMGIGLATAVAVDATIVRMILVPSTMALVGDPNWWFPKWLDRILPRLDIEGEPDIARDHRAGCRPTTRNTTNGHRCYRLLAITVTGFMLDLRTLAEARMKLFHLK